VIRAVDETVPRDVVEFAKLIHRSNPGDKITLDLVFTERNGRYYRYREGRTAVAVE
jgi:hypothetical protein